MDNTSYIYLGDANSAGSWRIGINAKGELSFDQLTGSNFLLKYPNCILGDEQGLGKTLMMIATISALIQKEKITKETPIRYL